MCPVLRAQPAGLVEPHPRLVDERDGVENGDARCSAQAGASEAPQVFVCFCKKRVECTAIARLRTLDKLAEIRIHPHAAEGTAAWRTEAIGRSVQAIGLPAMKVLPVLVRGS